MDNNEIAGIIVPVITPVDSAERVDEPAYRNLLRFLIEAGVHGIFAGGSAGEGPLLTDKEWIRMSEIAYEECYGKVHLLGGAIDTSTKRVIDRIKTLENMGYTNFVVVPTYYHKLELPEEHLRLFGSCKEAVGDNEIIAYNIPACTGSIIPVETICEMVSRGWINYCKDSSNDVAYFSRLRAEGGPLGLRILLGTEQYAADGLLMGVQGLVPLCANFEPSTFIAAYNARSEPDKLAALQLRISALVQHVLREPRALIAGGKGAVALLGFGSGIPISPTEPLSAGEQARLLEFCNQAKRRYAFEFEV